MKPRIPQQERSKETKTKILNAAMRLFAAKGYYETNSKEIAREAGIAVGSFYAYFEDKKDLFIAVLCNLYDQFDLSARIAAAANKDVKEIITELIETAFHIHDDYPEIHREAITLSYLDEDIRRTFEEYNRKIVADLRLILEKLGARVRDIEAAGVIIFSLIENMAHESRFSNIGLPEERLIRELVDLVYIYLFRERET